MVCHGIAVHAACDDDQLSQQRADEEAERDPDQQRHGNGDGQRHGYGQVAGGCVRVRQRQRWFAAASRRGCARCPDPPHRADRCPGTIGSNRDSTRSPPDRKDLRSCPALSRSSWPVGSGGGIQGLFVIGCEGSASIAGPGLQTRADFGRRLHARRRILLHHVGDDLDELFADLRIEPPRMPRRVFQMPPRLFARRAAGKRHLAASPRSRACSPASRRRWPA